MRYWAPRRPDPTRSDAGPKSSNRLRTASEPPPNRPERAENRRTQVGSGDRSEKIRTYNFPQGRITDHRVPLTIHRLQEVLDGDLEQVLTPLIDHFQAERLKDELG